jgi:hypothetical protein
MRPNAIARGRPMTPARQAPTASTIQPKKMAADSALMMW